jgi:beta-glucanase (GH16 family)
MNTFKSAFLASLFGVTSTLVSAEIIREDFNDLNNWTISQWASTAHEYSPDNVSLTNGQLVLKLNGSVKPTLPKGGEVTFSPKKFLYGSFRASIKTSQTPGSVIGWFVYKDGVPGDGNLHEVDMEILTRQPKDLHLTLHHDAYSVDYFIYKMSFDPTQSFHEYRFDWYKDSVVYFVDSQRIYKQIKKVPDDSCSIILNHWSKNITAWGGLAPTTDTDMFIDYMEYRSLDAIETSTYILAKNLKKQNYSVIQNTLFWNKEALGQIQLSDINGKIIARYDMKKGSFFKLPVNQKVLILEK